jgi:hypothetical protein
MVREQMTFFDSALFLLSQLSEYFVQMLAEISIQHFPAAFRDKNNVIQSFPIQE